MSREFIDKLETYWKQFGGRPPDVVVEWLIWSTVGASEADNDFVNKHVEPHLRKVEKALWKIYIKEGEPEDEWLAILRRSEVMDLSDTLALTVIARWYNIDPMDHLTRMSLLAGTPLRRMSRSSEAGLNTPRIIVGRLITILIVLTLLALCWLIGRQLIF